MQDSEKQNIINNIDIYTDKEIRSVIKKYKFNITIWNDSKQKTKQLLLDYLNRTIIIDNINTFLIPNFSNYYIVKHHINNNNNIDHDVYQIDPYKKINVGLKGKHENQYILKPDNKSQWEYIYTSHIQSIIGTNCFDNG